MKYLIAPERAMGLTTEGLKWANDDERWPGLFLFHYDSLRSLRAKASFWGLNNLEFMHVESFSVVKEQYVKFPHRRVFVDDYSELKPEQQTEIRLADYHQSFDICVGVRAEVVKVVTKPESEEIKRVERIVHGT